MIHVTWNPDTRAQEGVTDATLNSVISVISTSHPVRLGSRGAVRLHSLVKVSIRPHRLGGDRDTPVGAATGSKMANGVEGVRTAPTGHRAGEPGETDRGLHQATTRVAHTHSEESLRVPAQEV